MKQLLSLAVFTAVVFTLGQVPIANSIAAAEPKAGERKVVKIKGVEFALRWCPAGTFTMGSPKDEKNRNDNESQHKVQLTKGFYLGETEITQEQWGEVMGENPSEFKGRKLPVENVSWNDCQQYINKLNKDAPEGYKFALPTEAQWEYAARAGSTTAYCFGDAENKLGDYAWYFDNSGDKMHEVGTKKPIVWGIYDMHGNVWEWCQDWYDEYYGNERKNLYDENLSKEQIVVKTAVDPLDASSGSFRVNRGGSWGYAAEHCRSAYRDCSSPNIRSDDLGVRISLVPQGR
jgi:formylglycine-generating enzyme required for sulfatase activity